jgi:hypothetical protein
MSRSYFNIDTMLSGLEQRSVGLWLQRARSRNGRFSVTLVLSSHTVVSSIVFVSIC